MQKSKMVFVLFLIIIFLSGIYAVMYFNHPSIKIENMANESNEGANAEANEGTNEGEETSNSTCPNLLVKKGKVLMLYNTDLPMVDGQNPIPFFNLDEYIHYLEIQREKGINCPVLYLQEETTAQGEDVYKLRPSPFDLQGGLPTIVDDHKNKIVNKYIDSAKENPPYNTNQYNSFDPYGQDVGIYTEIDKIHDSTKMNKISDNPMDHNWAGITYTQQMVDSGKYIGNNVDRPILFQPRGAFDPTLPGALPPPKDQL
jgi:hypothetical protein